MKKQTLASTLSLTAALAGPIASFPICANARNAPIENQFAKRFLLKGGAPIRLTEEDGRKILGRIYLELDQTPYTPPYQNQLRGEMTGHLYFESDEAVETSANGQKYKAWRGLAGTEGNVLLDLIHNGGSNDRRYLMFGCETTLSQCRPERFEVFFSGRNVEIYVDLPEQFEVQINMLHNGVTVPEWKKAGQVKMTQIQLKDE